MFYEGESSLFFCLKFCGVKDICILLYIFYCEYNLDWVWCGVCYLFLCSNFKGILCNYCNVWDYVYFSVVYGVNILDLVVFVFDVIFDSWVWLS